MDQKKEIKILRDLVQALKIQAAELQGENAHLSFLLQYLRRNYALKLPKHLRTETRAERERDKTIPALGAYITNREALLKSPRRGKKP
ncbi:hypothetical protein [Bdellovibrio bacteriovorus]|uniref:hypothetical protein n=1 Tax=Bdellovibrio bacteriovorus TaxID=959 RepID=UPI0035A57EDE